MRLLKLKKLITIMAAIICMAAIFAIPAFAAYRIADQKVKYNFGKVSGLDCHGELLAINNNPDASKEELYEASAVTWNTKYYFYVDKIKVEYGFHEYSGLDQYGDTEYCTYHRLYDIDPRKLGDDSTMSAEKTVQAFHPKDVYATYYEHFFDGNEEDVFEANSSLTRAEFKAVK